MPRLREIHRVLAPGGRHVFTVPVLPTTRQTFARAVLGPDGRIQDRSPRICHPGGDWGYPVFTEFGKDLPELLVQAGFQTEVHFGPVTEDDLAQVYVCRKPGAERARPLCHFHFGSLPPSPSDAFRRAASSALNR